MEEQQSLLVYYHHTRVITYPLRKSVITLGSDCRLAEYLLPFPEVPPLALVLCQMGKTAFTYVIYNDRGQPANSGRLDCQKELNVTPDLTVVLASSEITNSTLPLLPDIGNPLKGILEYGINSYQIDDLLMVGKGGNNDLTVADDYLSQNHFLIIKREHHFFIRDLGSTNGTKVDNHLVMEAELPARCQIKAGNTLFNFSIIAEEKKKAHSWHGIIGESVAMTRLQKDIIKTANTNLPILIHGETGTGKELVARAVYEVNYPNNQAPYVIRNCATLTENLLGSELFGHRRGAFTGATENRPGAFTAANGGILFLDELGELPLSMQPALLRAVEYGEITQIGCNTPEHVNVRVIGATHRNLRQLVTENRFREDLFFRLSPFPLEIPPLRKRSGDILLLADFFLDTFGAKDRHFSHMARKHLVNYSWPGNVRELANCIQITICKTNSKIINVEDLALKTQEYKVGANTEMIFYSREEIVSCLKEHRGNKNKTAKSLHIARSSLYRLINSYGIDNNDLI